MSLNKQIREVMTALTSEKYDLAVCKYLLNYDLVNWKIFTDNFYQLTKLEIERILSAFKKRIDIHMVVDILSIAHIIGQSIELSDSLIQLLSDVNIKQIHQEIYDNVKSLLASPFAEERRVGLFTAGYFNLEEFIPQIKDMTDYDVLFEDAYYILGLYDKPKIYQFLVNKFISKKNNATQREAIAKVIAEKGNPIASLWLCKTYGLQDARTGKELQQISRELLHIGVQPCLFLDSKDGYLTKLGLKYLKGLILYNLPFDLDVLSNIQLVKLVRHLMDYSEKRPAIKIIRLLYALKVILNELFFDVDPTEITAETRTQLIGAYNELEKYPPKETLSFIRHYIDINLKPRSTGLSDVVYLIRIFNLKEYETDLLSIAKRNNLNLEEQVDLIGCLGDIGSEKSAAFIRQKIKQFLKNHPRKVIAQSNVNYSRLIDFDRDYEQTKLKYINYLYSEKIYDYYSDEDLTNIFYWYSIRSLSKISSKESISLFLEALDDSDPKIRYEAIKGLINNNVYNSEIEEKLVYLARNDKKVSIQSQALLALGSLNSQSAIPLFINHIYEAIEKKVFTIVSEIDSIYDNRWEFSFNKEKDFHHENKDSAEKDENSQTLPKFNKKYLDEDIVNWLNIHNKQKFSFFELREDFKSVLENNNFILDDFTLKEQYNPFLEKEELNEEWDYTISEKFRKLILVDVSLEAMKRTEAELPINELIEILDYELDDEILLDILIILAKRGINFARKELIELFDQNNYIRAREIIETLGSLTPHEFSKIAYSLKKSPDWILQDFLKNFQK